MNGADSAFRKGGLRPDSDSDITDSLGCELASLLPREPFNQVYSCPRRRGRETALSARGRAASLPQRLAPQALPVLAREVGDAAVRLVEFVGDLEHGELQ